MWTPKTLVISEIYFLVLSFADVRADRLTELFTAHWKSCDVLKVRLSCLTEKSLSAISIARHWLGNMWSSIQMEPWIFFFFPGSSKWPWPIDKQQLGLWINLSVVHGDSLITLFLTQTHTYHDVSLCLHPNLTPEALNSNVLIKILAKCIFSDIH